MHFLPFIYPSTIRTAGLNEDLPILFNTDMSSLSGLSTLKADEGVYIQRAKISPPMQVIASMSTFR